MYKTPLDYIPELDIYLKREDLQKSGSFKWRLVDYLIRNQKFSDYEELVISSTGNFANAFLLYKQEYPDLLTQKITIFIADNLPEKKYNRLLKLSENQDKSKVEIRKEGKRPKSAAMKYTKEKSTRFFVRASTKPGWENAYHSLATEIDSQLAEQDATSSVVFVCTSSGTAASGIIDKTKLKTIIVQTSKVHPIAKEFDNNFEIQEESVANAISDRVGYRKKELVNKLEQKKGSGVVVSNAQIESALELLNKIYPTEKFSPNAAIGLAGFQKLSMDSNSSYNLAGAVIIISGN